mgnify:CR=1 FL=1
MDEIKIMSIIDFNTIVSRHNFQRAFLVKDYYITLILYLIKDVNGIYFKGGTALNKIFLNHARLSEDIDFTLTKEEKEVRKEIRDILIKLHFVKEILGGKNMEGFLRMIIKCNSELGESDVFIDLNKRAKLILPSETHRINHFYSPFIPEFSFRIIAKEELVAEKIRATVTRNKPRDHFDVYKIIKADIPINLELVKKKCKEADTEFSVIKMFKKAQMLKNRWDKDMIPLLSEPISFQEVIKFLASHFKLKEKKKELKTNFS